MINAILAISASLFASAFIFAKVYIDEPEENPEFDIPWIIFALSLSYVIYFWGSIYLDWAYLITNWCFNC